MRKMGAGEMARETGDTTFHERKASTSRLQSLCALRFFSTACLGSSGLAERRTEESAAGSGGRAWLRAPPLGVCTQVRRRGRASATVSFVSAARQLCTRVRGTKL